jgi:hypothetical protein
MYSGLVNICLECDVEKLCRSLPVSQRNLLAPSSGPKNKLSVEESGRDIVRGKYSYGP